MRPAMKSLVFGLLTFALLFGLGQAQAGDTANASDGDNTLTTTVSDPAPEITGFDITDASDISFMHAQLDVQTTYFFNVTLEDENGWDDLKWAEIRVWFDNGTEVVFADQATGANYRAVLNYTNAGDLTAPELTEWSITEGNVVYTSGSSSIFPNVVNQNYTFKLAFSLNAQVRQADDPVTDGTTTYDDADSWNAEVVAKDANNTVTNQVNATGVYHEFGVFQFTSVSIGASWDAGTIAPGFSNETATVTVTHQSNRDYRMKVWFDQTLTNGTETIDISNVEILADGDTGDGIDTDTAFEALGETNAIHIHGNATSNKSHNVSGDEETTGVQFRVTVPLGTPSGTYVANLTIKVEQP